MNDLNNYELAEQDYIAGMKYKEIADKYGVSINTVKSWKKRYAWSRDKIDSRTQKGCTQNKKAAHKKEAVAEDVSEVIRNDKLTDRQRLFCLYQIRYFNYTKAYMKAYPDCSKHSAAELGSRLMKRPEIQAEIMRLKENRLNRELLSEEDIFQKYMDIAFADVTEFVEFGREEVQVMGPFGPIKVEDSETGEKKTLMKTVNTVRFKESAEVDGSIISEVKQGRDGASIKLADRMKALDWLAEHMDMATERQKAEVELLKTKTKNLTKDPEGEYEDDGFLEALNRQATDTFAGAGDIVET